MSPGRNPPGILKNRLLAIIARSTQELLTAHLKPAEIRRGSVLAEPGDRVDRIVFPESGIISLVVVTADGKHVEANVIGREGAFGLHSCLGKNSSFVRAEAQSDCRVWAASTEAFGPSICGYASVQDLIMRYVGLLWAESQQIAACNAVHDASSRLCRRLVQCAERSDDEALSFTHEILGEWLGLQRTTITLLLNSLQERGIVRLGRGKIKILDLDKLRNCACECATAIGCEELAQGAGIKL